MFAYRGSTAMITGASKGLGAAFAKELAGRGMNLVLAARSIDTLQDLADSLHGGALDGRPHGNAQVGIDLAAGLRAERLHRDAGSAASALCHRPAESRPP